MTINEANNICREFHNNTNPTDDDRFMYVEAMEFLIKETKDPRHMLNLGAFYYTEKEFDLALKYYEMAAEYDNMIAISNLGYIWYYGRTGEKNYEKAFYYFNKAREHGDPVAAYKVADMYKNGYYVEQDREKYKEIIEELYPLVKKCGHPQDPLPEVYTRLAGIRKEEGKNEEALGLLDEARSFLEWRLQCGHFFGDLTIMKFLIADIYKLREFDPEDFSLYDLYHILKTLVKVRFDRFGDSYEVESVEESGENAVKFMGKWYRTIDDFFKNAEIDGEFITTVSDELEDFEVV